MSTGVFHFHQLFYENINQEHNLLPVNGMYVVKIVCQSSLPPFLTWVSLAIFCLDQCQMQIACSAEHLCHWQEITHCSLMYELRVMVRKLTSKGHFPSPISNFESPLKKYADFEILAWKTRKKKQVTGGGGGQRGGWVYFVTGNST